VIPGFTEGLNIPGPERGVCSVRRFVASIPLNTFEVLMMIMFRDLNLYVNLKLYIIFKFSAKEI
jgi:hypothetical protein